MGRRRKRERGRGRGMPGRGGGGLRRGGEAGQEQTLEAMRKWPG